MVWETQKEKEIEYNEGKWESKSPLIREIQILYDTLKQQVS